MPAKLSLDERVERFWNNTKRVGDCLIWQGGVASNGYGKVAWINRESCYAHRISRLLTTGHLPKPPLQVLHTCDVKLCIEPAHLYEGTQKQNVRDAIDRGKFYMGEQHWMYNTDLSEDDRTSIVEEYLAGSSQSELARKYGLSQTGIGSITRKAGIDGTHRYGDNPPRGRDHWNHHSKYK